jgi:branched-chain amino acid transport system substrate-binding protein
MGSWLRTFTLSLLGMLMAAGPLSSATAPYVIHVIIPMTGSAAFTGIDDNDALQIFEKIANDRGGVRGQPIHFEVHDDQSSQVIAVQLFSQVTSTHPAVILGGSPSATCSALAPLAKNGPVLYCLTPAYKGIPGGFVFGAAMALSAYDRGMIGYFRLRGFKRLAIVSTTDGTGQTNDQATREILALPENRDEKVVAWEHFNPGDLNVAAQVQNIRNADPQAIVAWAGGPAFLTLLHGLRDAGVDLPLTSTGAGLTADQLSRDEAFLPSEMVLPSLPFLVPSQLKGTRLQKPVDELVAAFKAAGKPISPLGPAFVWDFSHMLVDALRKFGPTMTQEQLRDYILAIHDYAGADGIYDFRSGDQHGLSESNVLMVKWDIPTKSFVAVSRLGGAPLTK